jgi:chromosome segregation ATPase
MSDLLNDLIMTLSDSDDDISFGDRIKSLVDIRNLSVTPGRSLRGTEWTEVISPVRRSKSSFWDSHEERSPLKVALKDSSNYSESDRNSWLKGQDNELLRAELDSTVGVVAQLRKSLADLRKEASFKDDAVLKLRQYLRTIEDRAVKLERQAGKYKKKLLRVKRMSQTCAPDLAQSRIGRSSAEEFVQTIERRVEDLKREYEQAYSTKVLELNHQMNARALALQKAYDVSLNELHKSQVVTQTCPAGMQTEAVKLAVQSCSGVFCGGISKEKTELRWKTEMKQEELRDAYLKARRKIIALREGSHLSQQRQDSLEQENTRLSDEISQLKAQLDSQAQARAELEGTVHKLRLSLSEAEDEMRVREKRWKKRLVEQQRTHVTSLSSHESQLEQAIHNYEAVCKTLAGLKARTSGAPRPDFKDAIVQTDEDCWSDNWELMSLCLKFEAALESLKSDAKGLLTYCESTQFGKKGITERLEGNETPSLYLQIRTLKSTVETKLSELLARIDAFQEDKKVDRTRLFSTGRSLHSHDYTHGLPLTVDNSFESPDMISTGKIDWTHRRLSTIRAIEQLHLDFDCIDDTSLFNKPSPSFCDSVSRFTIENSFDGEFS